MEGDMGSYSFSKDRAMKADEGGYITASGVYIGVIKKMKTFVNDSKAGGVTLAIETIDGMKSDYINIYTQNKDGSDNFAKGKIDAACGILGIENLPIVKNGNDNEFPGIYNKKIAFALQKEEYLNRENQKKFKLELLHFFHADSLQTFKEKSLGIPALVSQHPIKDILIEESTDPISGQPMGDMAQVEQDSDLPF